MPESGEPFADVAHLRHLTDGLNEQRKKNEFCDVLLKVEGRTLPTHASVLSAASPFFRGLIAGEKIASMSTTATNDNLPQQIELKMPTEVSSDEGVTILLDLLDYIYTGKIVLTDNRMSLIVQVAEAFMLEGLTELVRNYGAGDDEKGESSDATDPYQVTLAGAIDPDYQEADEGEDAATSGHRKRKTAPRRLAVTRTASRRRVKKSEVAEGDDTSSNPDAAADPATTSKRRAPTRRAAAPQKVTRSKRGAKKVEVVPDGSSDDPASAVDAIPSDPALAITVPTRKPRRKPITPGQGRSYRCRVKDCDFLSGDAKAILEHRMVHSANHTFVCVTCNFMSGRWKKLLDHLMTSDHADETRCSLCGHEAIDPASLRRHLDRHAEDPVRPYFCDACEMRFVNPSLVAMHMIKHTKDRPFVCTQCGRGFKWRHCLYSHMQMHKDKEHICDQCGFRTAYKFTLHMHLRIHSGETFPCQHCDYRATRKQLLDDHVAAKHSTDRRFQCEVCGLKFALRMAYRRHSMTHNVQENLRFCPHCSFKTLRNSRLRAHVLKMHGEHHS